MLTKWIKRVAIAVAATVGWASAVSAQSLLDMPQSGAQADIDQRSVVPGFPSFYQSRIVKTCTADPCQGAFSRVPNNRLLRATNLNCVAGVADSNEAFFVLFNEAIFSPNNILDLFQVVYPEPSSVFSINEGILTFFEPGERPRLLVAGNTPTLLSCKLTGNLIEPP